MMPQTSHCGTFLPECAAGMVYIRSALGRNRRDCGAQPAGLNLPRFGEKQAPDCKGWNSGRSWDRSGHAERTPGMALALAGLLALASPNPSLAQFFSDRPPPVPPSSIPDVPSGGAISLAPPSGPAAAPSLPAPLTQPPCLR